MNLDNNKWAVNAYELLCVVAISMIVGIGIGWIEGLIAFHSSNLAFDGAVVGGLGAAIAGPLAYYALLRGNLTINRVANLLMLCLSIGILSALVLGWISSFITVIVLFLGSLSIRDEARKNVSSD